jgi:signal transduction histidine kinase
VCILLAYLSPVKKQAKMPVVRRHFTQLAWILLVSARALTAQPNHAALTNAVDVLALSAQDASSRIPVTVRGVVTAAAPDWAGRFFVQDASAGVFVDNVGGQQPVPGDLVEVSGVTHPGGYAPCISGPRWKPLGKAPLTEAKPVTIEQLMSGTEDSQRVKISGVVRSASVNGDLLVVELVSGGRRLRAYSPTLPNIVPQSLVGAEVCLSGTAAVGFNAPLRNFITVSLYVPRAADFLVVKPAPGNPFDEPLTPLNSIAQYRHDHSPARQVHVKGVVTFQRRGEDLFLRDETGGLQVKTKMAQPVAPGDTVEAAGFPAVENYLPVLEDAVFRKLPLPPVSLKPQEVTVAELQAGLHHSDYVFLSGRLVDRLVKASGQGSNLAVIDTTLVLQTTNGVLVAEQETSNPDGLLAAIPIGSLVEVSGVCLLESDENGKINSVRVLVPTARDVRILQRPSPWTPQRFLVSVAALAIVLVMAVTWSVMVSKRNAALQVVLRDKVKAQEELQQAHDLLETRVEQRSAQLKHEMTARQEAEVRFKATLAERTRLAQELHDTLEQSLTGIGLQLDTADKLLAKDSDAGKHHLGVARHWMKQSRIELRRSIWDLRSRELEQFDFPKALRMSAQQITERAGLNLKVAITGDVHALSEVAEENLLRISQEALTNVIKHADATEVSVGLEFSPQLVTLRITDNGRGFIPEISPGTNEGHFGILGMSERAKRLDGHLRVTSSPGSGTCLEAQIPTRPGNGNGTTVATINQEPT